MRSKTCLLLIVAGCGVPPTDSSAKISVPSLAEFEARYQTASGLYRFDDVLTSSEAYLKKLYEFAYADNSESADGLGTTQSALSIYTKDDGADDKWDVRHAHGISYCIGDPNFTTADATLVSSLMNIAATGWETAADIKFRHLSYFDGTSCTDSLENVDFNIRYFNCEDDGPDMAGYPGTYYATGTCNEYGAYCSINCTPVGTVPCNRDNAGDADCRSPFAGQAATPSNARDHRQLLVGNRNVLVQQPNQQDSNAAFVFRHEVGHILGFAHEFARADLRAEFPNLTCIETLANHPLTPSPGDYESVMMYSDCFSGPLPPPNPKYLTHYDFVGAAAEYGPSLTFDAVVGRNTDSLFHADDDLFIRSGAAGQVTRTSFYPAVANDSGPSEYLGGGYLANATQFFVGRFHDSTHNDIAVKDDSTGNWYIDYGYNGYLGNDSGDGITTWDYSHSGYRNGTAVVAIGDFDHDGLSDMAERDYANGTWYIDYSSNGFGSWD